MCLLVEGLRFRGSGDGGASGITATGFRGDCCSFGLAGPGADSLCPCYTEKQVERGMAL
jgi:hypothetical protein